MCKRLFALAAMLLLLAGCTVQPAAPETTHLDPTAPTERVVKVDDSRYTPRAPVAPVYTRLTQEWIPDLLPADDYGFIYPFPGVAVSDGANDSYLYGMCDAAGRIIADPGYMSIEPVTTYDVRSGTEQTMPMWQLNRPIPDEWTSDTGTVYPMLRSCYALANRDGSMVTACEFSIVMGLDACICAGREDGSFVLYAPTGELLADTRELPFSARLTQDTPWSLQYGEGLLTISLTDGAYYMNLSGELVLGPYREILPFSDGVAAVHTWDNRWGYLRQDGSWAISPQDYDSADSFRDGYALVFTKALEAQVINKQGQVMLSGCDYLWQTSFGYSGTRTDSTITAYFDRMGQPLALPQSDTEWCYTGTGTLFYREQSNGLTLYKAETGQQCFVEGAQYAYPIRIDSQFAQVTDGLLPYIQLGAYTDDVSQAWFFNTETMSTVTAPPFDESYDYLYVTQDAFTEKLWLVLVTSQALLLDDTLSAHTQCGGSISVYNGHYMLVDDWSCTLCEPDGTVLFRYPLVMAIED